MSNIDKVEQKIERYRSDLAAAKEKFEEWKNKISSIEKEIEAAENLRIVLIVRNTEITPETLKQILSMQKNNAENFIGTTVLSEIVEPAKPVYTKSEPEKERKIDDEIEID